MNAYRILMGKPEGKRPLGRPRRRWVDNIKMDLREIGWDGMKLIELAKEEPVEGCCDHGDEPSGSLKLLGISQMAAQLAASQEGLSSVSK
jgi:hypothetical protein